MLKSSMQPASVLIESACELDAVRDAARRLRGFMEGHGLHTEELDAWELLIVEAGNNAVQNATPAQQTQGLRFQASAMTDLIELTITDHTAGFDWPEDVSLPNDESESGRGLFLINALCDGVRYERGLGENHLRVHKVRLKEAAPAPAEDASQMVLHSFTAELAASYDYLSTIFRLSADVARGEMTETGARRWLEELTRLTRADWFIMRQANETNKTLKVLASSRGLSGLAPLPVSGEVSTYEVEVAAFTKREVRMFGMGGSLQGSETLSKSVGGAPSGVVHPMVVGKENVGTLAVGFKQAGKYFSAGELSMIQTFSDFLGLRLLNERAQRDALKAKLVSKELQIAASIQRSLLPKTLPSLPGYELAAHSKSAYQVGGDFFDAILIGEHGILLAIADVMGKGVPAALFAAIFRSHLRSRPDLAEHPAELMKWLNHTLFADLDGVDMFITAQLVFVDCAKRQLSTANAGHCPSVLVMGKDAKVLELGGEGPPLGITATPEYEELVSALEEPVRLLLYTDGVIESFMRSGEGVGIAKLSDWMKSTALTGVSASQSCRQLEQLVRQTQVGTTPSDDVAYIVLTEQSGVQETP